MALIRIDPESEEYRQFVRLYEAARALRPSPVDRWNGELYATVGEGSKWGSFHPAGHFTLSKELVFDKLGPDATPEEQVQALATILHEANHARVAINAPEEPNAVVSRHSKALDEGLTEWVSVVDVPALANSTGYGELPEPKVEYLAAHTATGSLLVYAAGPNSPAELADRALDAPVVMRWDVIADAIVQNKLGEVVPSDPVHQRAARAELINAMIQTPGWKHLDKSRPDAGEVVWRDTNESLDQALRRIRDHYAGGAEQPYPAVIPNEELRRSAAVQGESLTGSQERIISRGGQPESRKLRSPAAANRSTGEHQPAHPSGRQDDTRPAAGGPRTRRSRAQSGRATDRAAGDLGRFLIGSAPAAGATRRRPDLGDGARGAGGAAARPGREIAPGHRKE